MMLRWTSAVPPQIMRDRAIKNSSYHVESE